MYVVALQGSHEATALDILRRVNINHLEKVIKDFLQAIFNEKGCDLIPTIIQ